jgi:hypothetical protein
MGANEFNSEPTPQQSDGDNRDADNRIEDSESILSRVRAEQRNFEGRITPLLSQSQSISKSSPTLESLEFKGLKSEITELKHGWKLIVAHIENLNKTIQELKKTPTPKPITIEKEVYRSEPIGKYGTIGLFTALFTLSIFFISNQIIPVKISDDIHNYLQGIWQRTGYTNTKLQRVERRFGTDPNQRR